MIAYSNNIVFTIFAVLFPILVLCSVKRGEGLPLSVNNTRCIKGVLAIWIMLLHFAQHTTLSGLHKIVKMYDYTGFLAVAGFLFVAGYVFQRNIHRKKFLLKQNIRIYLTWVIICVLFLVPLSNGLDTVASIKYILFMGLRRSSDGIVNGCWFIIALIFLYTVHWLISQIQYNKKVRLLLLLIAIVFYALFWIVLGAGVHWYSAVVAYYLGVTTAEYESSIKKKINYKKASVSFVGLVLSLVLSIMIDNKVVILSYWLATACFCTLIYYIFLHIEIKSRLIGFVGAISLEFFLVHIKLLDCMINYKEVIPGYYFAVMLVVCLIASKLIYEFMKRLMRVFFSNS